MAVAPVMSVPIKLPATTSLIAEAPLMAMASLKLVGPEALKPLKSRSLTPELGAVNSRPSTPAPGLALSALPLSATLGWLAVAPGALLPLMLTVWVMIGKADCSAMVPETLKVIRPPPLASALVMA